MVGDLDNDGEVEMAILINNPDQIHILGDDCTVKDIITLPASSVDNKDGGMSIGDVDGNGYIDLFVKSGAFKMARYQYNPGSGNYALVWETSQIL